MGKKGGNKEYCKVLWPRRKVRHFNEAWAKIAADATTERDGEPYRPYHCVCGWWHIANKAKRVRKRVARESRNARRNRRKAEKAAASASIDNAAGLVPRFSANPRDNKEEGDSCAEG